MILVIYEALSPCGMSRNRPSVVSGGPAFVELTRKRPARDDDDDDDEPDASPPLSVEPPPMSMSSPVTSAEDKRLMWSMQISDNSQRVTIEFKTKLHVHNPLQLVHDVCVCAFVSTQSLLQAKTFSRLHSPPMF